MHCRKNKPIVYKLDMLAKLNEALCAYLALTVGGAGSNRGSGHRSKLFRQNCGSCSSVFVCTGSSRLDDTCTNTMYNTVSINKMYVHVYIYVYLRKFYQSYLHKQDLLILMEYTITHIHI